MPVLYKLCMDCASCLYVLSDGHLKLGYMYLSKEVVPFPTVSVSVGLLKDSVKRKNILKPNQNIE
jgi:hypothetical protein